MDRVAVVTDSNVCLPKELVEQYGIHIVPLKLIFEDRVYRDGVDITPTQFYELLQKTSKLPTTASPSPATFLEVYCELSQRTSSIIYVSLSARVSVLFNLAQQAKERAKEQMPQVAIEVLDCGTAAGAQGFVVLAAARAAASGQSLAQVTEATRGMIPRVHLIVLLDSLHYMAKGGRVPKIASLVSSVLSIKPILHISGGEVGLLERTRTKPRAVERLLAIMKERVGAGKPLYVNLMHANVPEEAERIKEQILSRFDCAEIYITEFTPVIGTHSGPGTLALAFYSGT